MSSKDEPKETKVYIEKHNAPGFFSSTLSSTPLSVKTMCLI